MRRLQKPRSPEINVQAFLRDLQKGRYDKQLADIMKASFARWHLNIMADRATPTTQIKVDLMMLKMEAAKLVTRHGLRSEDNKSLLQVHDGNAAEIVTEWGSKPYPKPEEQAKINKLILADVKAREKELLVPKVRRVAKKVPATTTVRRVRKPNANTRANQTGDANQRHANPAGVRTRAVATRTTRTPARRLVRPTKKPA